MTVEGPKAKSNPPSGAASTHFSVLAVSVYTCISHEVVGRTLMIQHVFTRKRWKSPSLSRSTSTSS